MQRLNIDDGDMWIGEFDNDVLASIQSSYVTVGNFPGIEARIYGSEGAIIVRLVEEFGICQTIKTATKDAVEFVEREIPQKFFPAGGTQPRAVGLPVLLQPVRRLRHRDPRPAARTTRATSPRARSCRRPSTRSSAPSRERAWVAFPEAEGV